MSLLTTLEKALRLRTAAEAEADYFNAATSRADLEMRFREVNRRRFDTFPRL
jgi:hypothetical protein